MIDSRTKKVEEKKKEWIIPLIRKNNWRLEDGEGKEIDDFRAKSGKTDGRDHTVSSTVPEPEPISEEEALRRQALKELLGTFKFQIFLFTVHVSFESRNYLNL